MTHPPHQREVLSKLPTALGVSRRFQVGRTFVMTQDVAAAGHLPTPDPATLAGGKTVEQLASRHF